MAVRSLITGGAGFVGSHLAEELLRRDEEVYILDDLSTGSIENIEHLKPNARFHYTLDSVLDVARNSVES
jgi:UDP-glucose 4-epimerase